MQNMDPGEWNQTFSQIQRKGVLLNENVLKENFLDVVNKAFDKEMGFGYISDNGYKPRARVILQGKNPFIDNHTGLLSPVMEGHLPYSQVYHLAWGGDSVDAGTTYCILRHFLHVPSLSGDELNSIKVAMCSVENVDSIDYKVSSFENGSEVVERKFSVKEEIKEENYSTTVTNMVVTQERKQSVTITDNGNHVDKKPLQKKSTQLLLEQMNQIVRPIANTSAEGFAPGQVVLTVHKAKDIEKKGFVGKADPYVVLTYGTQKEKSATVNNNHNPVWQITGYLDVEEQSSNEITIEVFDDDIGKDDFLGKTIVDIHEICKEKEFVNKWIPLTECKSGEILISAKFIPLQRITRPVGHISLTLHKAKKIEKKNMLKKADPYVLIKLGKDKHKTKTVNNSHNPTWNYAVEMEITEASPRQISFEVFDDDIGNDATLGNVTLDLDTLMQKQKFENQWSQLENCKSGQLLISAKFNPSPVVEEIETDFNHTVMSVKREVITEKFEEKMANMESMEEPSVVLKKVSQQRLENKSNQSIEFVDPIYSDDQFVVVEKKTNNWFMVVSPHQNLPISVNLVPFKQPSEPNSPIFIYPLPKGGFHNIKRVVHSGKGLKKCGYEKACVLRAGEPYQFWTDVQGKNYNLGNLKTETFGPDRSWVVYKPEYFEAQDYIEATLRQSEQAEPLFSGPISLYDTLNVEAA
eukprot:TRINITY_DN8222_c0_g1_i1.p1 TRINITY_DN8222_c0_g1~~TRINITY_DN8222_c0_g1_i1.p1  ORF type:complete len:693 (+),score=210.25 TRINITY_DN8222_c0_g1_i1:41-2119(+)